MKQLAKDAIELESGIRLVEVRVRNFRCLKSIDVALDNLTILVGCNNSGKSSFLDALYASIGDSRRDFLQPDDIYLAPTEQKAPLDRSIIVDVLIRPTDAAGNPIESFPADSFWLELWGKAINQDQEQNDFLAMRTRYSWNAGKSSYETRRQFLQEWPSDPDQVESAKVVENMFVASGMIEPFQLHYLDAKRDISDDLRRERSVWGRLTADLGLEERDVDQIERTLNDLNTQMVTSSKVLSHALDHLSPLREIVTGGDKGVEIAAVSRKLRDLSKGIGLDFTSDGSQTFPMQRHGMGTRSAASVLTFRALLSWRARVARPGSHHPLMGLEEPEAHLHPQAQRAVVQQMLSGPGQVIVSTHSPYIVTQGRISNIRHFSRSGSSSNIAHIREGEFEKIALKKINEHVIASRGEILFARALLLVSGPTEELSIPVFASHVWKKSTVFVGVSVIGVKGDDMYAPFLRLANKFGIPWFIFSDGEVNAKRKIMDALAHIGVTKPDEDNRVAFIPGNQRWEEYLVSEGQQLPISEAIDEVNSQKEFMKKYAEREHGRPAKAGGTNDYLSSGGADRALVDYLSNHKVPLAEAIAKHIVSQQDENKRVPTVIRAWLEFVASSLKL